MFYWPGSQSEADLLLKERIPHTLCNLSTQIVTNQKYENLIYALPVSKHMTCPTLSLS